MMKCPCCKREGRVLKVNENAPEGVVATYICTNRQCANRGQEIGQEILRAAKDPK